MKKLKNELKTFLKNELVIDIFIIGSSIKDKFAPADIDLIVLFKEKDYKKIEDILYDIKNKTNIDNLHLEPVYIDNFFVSKISQSIIHEGYSIRHNKPLHKLLGFNAYSLFVFSLEKLPNIDKVRFAQTLYGRKNDGLLKNKGGKSLGKGAFLCPIEKTELFNEVLIKHKATFRVNRVFVND